MWDYVGSIFINVYALTQFEVVNFHLLPGNKIYAVEFMLADPRFSLVPVKYLYLC